MVYDVRGHSIYGGVIVETEIFNFCSSIKAWCTKNSASVYATTHMGPLADDLMDLIFPGSAFGVWPGLAPVYKNAWYGEIIRRIKAAGGYNSFPTDLQEAMKPLLKRLQKSGATGTATAVTSVRFSQFNINNHFQGSYVGQPGWLADKKIVECARLLNTNNDLSATMRTKLHWHGGQWVTLNNRGFALHALAAVTPMRFVFDPTLGSEETKRFADSRAKYEMQYRNSVPASRRTPGEWIATIPTDVVSVSAKKPFNKAGVAVPVDIEYTVQAQLGGADAGNALVRTSV